MIWILERLSRLFLILKRWILPSRGPRVKNLTGVILWTLGFWIQRSIFFQNGKFRQKWRSERRSYHNWSSVQLGSLAKIRHGSVVKARVSRYQQSAHRSGLESTTFLFIFYFIQWKPTDTWPRDRCGRAQLVLLPSLADFLHLGAGLFWCGARLGAASD